MKDYKNRTAAVLGATGSVGIQAVDALTALGVRITLITAGNNIDELVRQAQICDPEMVAVPNSADAEKLKTRLSCKVYGGENAVFDALRECGADLIVHAISGMAGIPYALCAAETGARIAMANKEAIISAGHLIYDGLAKSGGELIPVDSEHSAIFQCLTAQGAARLSSPADPSSVRRILLTASGGPFFGKSRSELERVTPEMALAHPTWKMGKKITVDCATLMNKGFELIEACRLFGVDPDKVEILVHRQSIIHSMVEYTDGAVIAEMSYPDMRDCVRYALTYPERAPFGGEALDLTKVGTLTFDKPDRKAFPLLDCAENAFRMGGCAPAALIAADEEAVAAFLGGELSFNGISDKVMRVMDKITYRCAASAEEIYAADREARQIFHSLR